MYFFYKLTAKGFSKAKKKDFSFRKKTIDEISEIEKQSKVILDVQHPKQTGLTMRTIEMVGMKKKIITTNEEIQRYDFYDKNNIQVINRNNPIIDISFFNSEYHDLPEHILKKYDIDQWVLDVIDFNNRYEK